MSTHSMFDLATARRNMVDGQVRTADVTNLDIIAAMLAVPRERFVPPTLIDQAYADNDLPIGKGRALLRPMALAKLLQAARVNKQDRVLDVGCGPGYSSAVLGYLAGSVVALEDDPALASQAKAALTAFGSGNVEVAVGPLNAGWPGAAPYDVILLNGATEVMPQPLGHQLKPNGRLLCIFGRAPSSRAMLFNPSEGELAGRPIFDAAARVLPGFVAPPTFVF